MLCVTLMGKWTVCLMQLLPKDLLVAFEYHEAILFIRYLLSSIMVIIVIHHNSPTAAF